MGYAEICLSSCLSCIGYWNQGDFGEALLNQEAVVTAAAAEAVALARAAAEVAREVARMVQTDHRPDVGDSHDVVEDSYLTREVLRTEVRPGSRYAEARLLDDAGFVSIFSDESESDDDEQGARGVAVKSARQPERRARRVRAAMKVAKSFSDRRPVTASSRKKRVKGCRNSLGCFYKMSGRKLLTAKQEVELSEGIQVTKTNTMPRTCVISFPQKKKKKRCVISSYCTNIPNNAVLLLVSD